MARMLEADIPQGYTSSKVSGEFDEVLNCVVDVEGVCKTEYVDEILTLFKDCDIEAPEETSPPSALRVRFTQWGIALFYALHDAKTWVSRQFFGDSSTPSQGTSQT